MKRVMWKRASIIAGLSLGLVACSGPPSEAPVAAKGGANSGWTRTPVIQAVQHAGPALVFRGGAEPGARVVLRSQTGAYAAVADARGVFEIRITAPTGPLLLRPETQVGQDAVVSPDRLLILDGGRGPIAVLRSGGATRRLDPAPALGAVDSDGRSVLASGRAAPEGPLAITVDGTTMQVQPGRDGLWSALLPAAPGEEVRLGGREFVWPGPGAAEAGELQAERLGGGWRVGWSDAGGARQWTWLPVAQAS